MESAAARIRASDASGEAGRLQAALEIDGRQSQFYFQSTDIRLVPNNEAFIATTLLPCMVTGNDLLIDGPVSKSFLQSLQTIIDIYHVWHPKLRRVQINNPIPAERERPSNARVGLFFTCGVDSWYTLLKHRDEITDLIHIQGLEHLPEDSPGYLPSAQLVRRVAARLGKNVIEVETNLRPLYDAHRIRWVQEGHGAVLVSVGHLLYPEFGRIYIAASHTYAHIKPWGSSPLLDPLWSTEGLEFVHDGCEASRVEKVRCVARSDLALQNLRVCFERPVHALNCGRCEKCIRTMLELLAVGALDRCTAFEVGLDPARVAALRIKREGMRHNYEDSLAALEQTGKHRAMARAVRQALRRSRRPEQLRALLQAAWPGIYPVLRQVRNGFRRSGRPLKTSTSGKAG